MSGLAPLRTALEQPIRTAIWAFCSVLACHFALVATAPVQAINIVIQLQQEGMNPGDDPTGGKLNAIANAAAAYWEDYLPESGTYEIDLWWDTDDISGNTWGQWSWDSVGDNNIRINANPKRGDGSDVDWFFDPTPMDNSEYDFQTQNRWLNPNGQWVYGGGQWLYRDLDASEQNAWFDGSPPDVMEVGYRGRATDPTIMSQADLLSTVIHEIGHELGVNGTGGPWEAATAWLPYGSATMLENGAADHLGARSALMCGGCGLTGTRRMPSAVDIMAAADDENMSNVDLPRQDYVATGFWSHGQNWTEGKPPHADDDAYVRSNNLLIGDGNVHVKNLFLSNNGDVQMAAGKTLQVDEATSVGYGPGASNLWIGNGATALLNTLTLDGGQLQLLNGTVETDGPLLITATGVSGGQISTYGGQINLHDVLKNDGEIIAFGGVTTFNKIGSAPNVLDLDGDVEQGKVRLILGDLIFNETLRDEFDGEFTIHDGNVATVNANWTFGQAGLVHFSGLGSDPAVLNGTGALRFRGQVKASGIGAAIGVIASQQARFESTAAVAVAAGDRLVLESNVFMEGGKYYGAGAIEQQGDIVIEKDTVVDVHEFDWGNSTISDLHQTTVTPRTKFTINSPASGTPRNEYRGLMTVDGGELIVKMDGGWLLPARIRDAGASLAPGTLAIRPSRKLDPAYVKGSPLTVEGNVVAQVGQSHMEADFITTPTAEIRSTIAAELLLKGRNTFNGGSFVDNGEIAQWGDTHVVGDTTIDVLNYDLDGNEAAPSTTTIDPGVTFAINSQRIDKPNEAFNGTIAANGGTLQINTPGGWKLGETGRLKLTNLQGPAWILGTHLTAHGTIAATGGNEVFASTTFLPTAAVEVNQAGDILRMRAHTNYEGGTYTGSGGIIQEATAFVNAPTTMHQAFFDMDGVSETNFTELHADLILNVDRIDQADNRFDGVLETTDTAELGVNTPTAWEMHGQMNVAGAPGTVLRVSGAPAIFSSDVNILQGNTLEFASDVSGPGNFLGDGSVVFLGEYSPGASPAQVNFDGDLSLGADAVLALELGGTTLGTEYDHLKTMGDADLQGTLNVSLLTDASGDLFLPQVGDQFALMNVGGMLNGQFDAVNLPTQVANTGLSWALDYANHWLTLRLTDLLPIEFAADYNSDGAVDAADLALWSNTWGNSGPGLAADGNGNGQVDGGDFLMWQQQYGQGSASAIAASQAVPEPTAVVLVALGLAVGLASRGRLVNSCA